MSALRVAAYDRVMNRIVLAMVVVVVIAGCKSKKISTLPPSTFTDHMTQPPRVTIIPTIDVLLTSNATLGVTAMAHLPKLVDARVRLGYGLGVPTGPWIEAYAGYPLLGWRGVTKHRWKTDGSHYVHARVPAHRVLTVEGGVEASQLGLSRLDALNVEVSQETKLLTFPHAGLRLTTSHRVSSSGFGRGRGYWTMWLHAVFPSPGVPDAPTGGRVFYQTTSSGKHDGEVTSAIPVGGAFGAEVQLYGNLPHVMWRLEFVVHPGPDLGHIGMAALLFPINL